MVKISSYQILQLLSSLLLAACSFFLINFKAQAAGPKLSKIHVFY